MNKKITIAPKPLSEKRELAIDKWVAGEEDKQDTPTEEKFVRFTVVLPENIYYNLKINSVKKRVKLKDLVISVFDDYLKHISE